VLSIYTLPPQPTYSFYLNNNELLHIDQFFFANFVFFFYKKGDAVIRAYEVVDDSSVCHYLTDYKSTSPQSDIIAFPPRSVDVLSCEIIRFAKLSIDKIEHLMFQVPRRDTNNKVFQEDLYPPTLSGEPGLSAKEWLKGKNADPLMISLKPEGSVSIYEVDPGKKGRFHQYIHSMTKQDGF
jgi:hypothetical protein